ncbi:MAG: hypothetical protein M3Q63_00730 [bacterium]|nr:hypothetical protein [bacterium]
MKIYRTYSFLPRPVMIVVFGERTKGVLLRVTNGTPEEQEVNDNTDPEVIELKRRLQKLREHEDSPLSDIGREIILIDFDGFQGTRMSPAAMSVMFDYLRIRFNAIAVMGDNPMDFVVIEGCFRGREFGRIIKRTEILD